MTKNETQKSLNSKSKRKRKRTRLQQSAVKRDIFFLQFSPLLLLFIVSIIILARDNRGVPETAPWQWLCDIL